LGESLKEYGGRLNSEDIYEFSANGAFAEVVENVKERVRDSKDPLCITTDSGEPMAISDICRRLETSGHVIITKNPDAPDIGQILSSLATLSEINQKVRDYHVKAHVEGLSELSKYKLVIDNEGIWLKLGREKELIAKRKLRRYEVINFLCKELLRGKYWTATEIFINELYLDANVSEISRDIGQIRNSFCSASAALCKKNGMDGAGLSKKTSLHIIERPPGKIVFRFPASKIEIHRIDGVA